MATRNADWPSWLRPLARNGRSGRRQQCRSCLEAWFVVASGSWAPITIRQTRSVVDRYLHPQLGSIRVGELTPSVIDAAYVRLRVSGGGRGQGLSSGTLARVHVVLRSALAQARRWGWIFDNPVERAHRIKVRKTERQPPTPDEVAVLIGWLAEHDLLLRLFVAVAVSTGARRAQLLAVRWENIDLVRGRVAFVGGWVEGPNGPVLSDTKTSRRHQVQIDPVTVGLLRQRFGDGRCGYVFSDDDGVSAWKPHRATKSFLRALEGAGLRRFRLLISIISWRPSFCRLVSRWRSCRNALIINGSRPRWTTTLTPSRRAMPTQLT